MTYCMFYTQVRVLIACFTVVVNHSVKTVAVVVNICSSACKFTNQKHPHS